MAENLLSGYYWKQYGNTTLHTNYNYFRNNTLFQSVDNAMMTYETKFDDDLRRLQEKEQSFYNMFGHSDYQSFKKWVSDYLLGPDGQIVAKFSNEGVRNNILSKIINEAEEHKNLSKAEITLMINTEDANKKLKEITKALRSLSKDVPEARIGFKGEIIFQADPKIMKMLLNRLKQTKFHISSYNSDLLSSYLKDQADFGDLVFSANGRQLSNKELSSIIQYRPFPWGYRNSEIAEAWEKGENRIIIEEELNEAIKKIREIIKSLCSDGSTDMNRALVETLDDVVPYPFKPDNYYNIFFVGANWRNGLIGAFGEFGTALLINYLRIKGARLDVSRAKVIGQELGKQDVSFADLGVQVKNYSIAESEAGAFTRKTIEVNQHPSQLADYFSDKQSFLGFMANYYFNENIQRSPYGNPRETKEKVIEKIQGEYLGELLRLAVQDVQIQDTITFYAIGGRYLVPGSALLEYYNNYKEKLRVSIKGPQPRYKVGEVTRDENGYWQKDGNENGQILWYPTSENLNLFSQLISNDISFVSEMENDFNLVDYALY